MTANSKEKVLNALGDAAAKLRRQLGESLATVQKFDVPLEQATTSSLEALQAYSLGLKTFGAKGAAMSLPYDQRAIALDPNFAMGYWRVAVDYFAMGELGRASEYYSKAFELRDRASEREKLLITLVYYGTVTGELDKTAQASEEMITTYPRDPVAYVNLGVAFSELGTYERAVEAIKQVQQLIPGHVVAYETVANYLLALQRFDEARNEIQQAQARKLDDFILHNVLYALAFLRGNFSGMAQQQQWFAASPAAENYGLSLASDSEAYAGRLSKARELMKRSVISAVA